VHETANRQDNQYLLFSNKGREMAASCADWGISEV